MSTSIGTNESGKVVSDCWVIFKQPSRASTANPYQIQYRETNQYDNANKKKYGAAYTKWSSWKNAVAVSGIALNATTNPDSWQKANKAVNTSSDYQKVLNLKDKQLASGIIARVYQFRIRTYNKKTNRHGAWVTQQLTIRRAATMTGDAVHLSNGLLLGFNLKWGGDAGTFNVTSVNVNGKNILSKSVTGAKLTVVKHRTASTHPPAPAAGYTGYNCTIPKSAFTATGYAALGSAKKVTITAYYKTPAGVVTYFGNKAGAEMPILNEDIDIATPVINAHVYKNTGEVSLTAKKGQSSDVVGALTFTLEYFDDENKKWTSLKSTLSNTSPNSSSWYSYYAPPLNARLRAWVNFYGAAKDDYKKSKVIEFSNTTLGLFTLSNFGYIEPDEIATVIGNPELTISRKPIVSTYRCFGRKAPVVAFGDAVERSITLKGTVFRKMTSSEKSASGYDDQHANTDAWKRVIEEPKTRLLRTPDGKSYTVVINSLDITRKHADLADITVTMTEVG